MSWINVCTMSWSQRVNFTSFVGPVGPVQGTVGKASSLARSALDRNLDDVVLGGAPLGGRVNAGRGSPPAAELREGAEPGQGGGSSKRSLHTQPAWQPLPGRGLALQSLNALRWQHPNCNLHSFQSRKPSPVLPQAKYCTIHIPRLWLKKDRLTVRGFCIYIPCC